MLKTTRLFNVLVSIKINDNGKVIKFDIGKNVDRL